MKELYLVLLRCGIDDLPLHITDDAGEAIAFAEGFDPRDSIRLNNMLDIFRIDVSFFHGVTVLKFVNGRPESVVNRRALHTDLVQDLMGE